MCPEVPMAYISMAFVHSADVRLGTTKSPQESLEMAINLAQKAISLDDNYPEAHTILSVIYALKREFDKSVAEGARAVTLNPNGATPIAQYASSLEFAGRSKEAIPLFQKAIRMNPFGPGWYYFNFGHALRNTGQFEEAVLTYKKGLQRAPGNIFCRIHLAATYSMMGLEKETRDEAAEVLRINPKFSLRYFPKTYPNKDLSVTDKVIDALRKAGLK